MKQEALTQFPIHWMTITALILFLVSFITIWLWAYNSKNKALIEQHASLALDGSLEEMTTEPKEAKSVKVQQ